MTVAQRSRSRLAWAPIAEVDPELWAAMVGERERQRNKIELIASENYAFAAVLEAQGSWLTNKYAEGLPGKRYYGGCEKVDVVEDLARDRVKLLFGAEHANVQPHAGAQANMAAFFAFLEPGDTFIGMNLAMGGHLTHGSPVNFSGKWFNVVPYGLDPETETIDYDEVERLAHEHHPKLILAGGSAYPRTIDFERFSAIAKSIDAKLMVDMAHIAGLVAGGVHPSPVPWADVVTSTAHKTLRGPRGGLVLCKEKYAKEIDSQAFPQYAVAVDPDPVLFVRNRGWGISAVPGQEDVFLFLMFDRPVDKMGGSRFQGGEILDEHGQRAVYICLAGGHDAGICQTPHDITGG